MNGCAIELNKKSKSQITYVAEGVETGLSVLAGDPNAKVLAITGKECFKNIDISRLNNKVVLCLDNDGDATFKTSIIEKSVFRLIDAGKSVSLMIPKKTGDDFNDVLKRDGASAIKQHMDNTVDAQSIFIHSTKKQIGKNGSQENNSLIKKLLAIENNQVSIFKSIESAHDNILKNTSTLQKNHRDSLSNKIDYNMNAIKTHHHNIMEKEI
jgi:hypothetical protein